VKRSVERMVESGLRRSYAAASAQAAASLAGLAIVLAGGARGMSHWASRSVGVPLAEPRVRLSAALLARITVLRGAASIRHAL